MLDSYFLSACSSLVSHDVCFMGENEVDGIIVFRSTLLRVAEYGVHRAVNQQRVKRDKNYDQSG